MANLVQVAEELEYVPKDQLIQMSQNPDSRYPQYLVLSEIQRRTQMEKMYNAQEAAMNQPQMTVADEVVSEYAQPQQGLAGMNAGGSGNTDVFSPPAMPASPMQQMASGGRTGYKNKGKTEYKEIADDYGKQLQEIFEKEKRYKKRYSDYEKGERFTYPLTPRDYVVSDKEYKRLKEGNYVMGEGALQEYRPFLMLLNALDGESGARYMPESEVKGLKAKLKASIIEDKLSQMGMASGGITGYQNTGRTTYSTYSGPNARRELLASLNIDPTGMSEDEIAQAIIYSQTQQRTQQPLPAVDTGLNQPVDLTEVSSPSVPSVDTPEEDSWLDRAGSWARERYTDEGEGLGSVDWSNVLMDASWAIPGTAALKGLALAGKAGVGAIRSGAALAAAKRGLTATAEGAKKAGSTTARYANPSVSPLLTRPNPKIVRGQGFTMRDPSVSARIPSATRLGVTGTGLVGANMAYNYMTDDEIAVSKSNEQDVVETTQDKLNELLADINKRQDTGTAEKKGLASFLPQADGLDIAQLGGIIMGARNMSELGAGIAGLAGSIQDRRMKEKLSGIQGDLYKAQTDKYRADIENMEPDQLVNVMSAVQKMMKMEQDGNNNPTILDDYRLQYEAAYKKWAELTGTPYLTPAERDDLRLKELGLEITG
tara:strand:- start:1043 stop:3004 length:1962 start_codon:yes stop_codon:yes gene_type:complete